MPNTQARATSLEPLLDIHQVAELLGVGVRHIRRLVFEHRIPYIKWGRLVRFDRAAIADWIAEATVDAAR